jgi:hypothetical protein
MADIKPTRIGTPDPIDICTGIALFPAIGAIRAGNTAVGDSSYIIKPFKKRILLWRLGGNAGFAMACGVCGPSYASKFTVSGSSNGTDVSMDVSDDRADAGIVAGFEVEFPVLFELDQGLPRWSWRHGWGVRWTRAFKLDKKPKIDIIKMIVDLIKKLMKEKKKSSDIKKGEDIEKKDRKDPQVTIKVSAWGMFDSVSDQFNSGKGVVAPSPTLTIVINIVPMWPQLEAIDKGLKTVWGGFSLGPKLHVIVPIFIRFRRVLLDDAEVKNLEYSGGKLVGRLDAPKDSVDTLRVDVSHEPTITLGVSFFMSVSVCKKFSFDPETPMLRLDELLGLKIGAVPYCTAFTNTVGSTNPGSTDLQGVECDTGKIIVELDP